MPISMVRCCASVGVCWAALLIINFALGGSGKVTHSGIACGSMTFYILWLLFPPMIIMTVTVWNALHMNTIERRRQIHGIVLPREQVQWTPRNLVYYSGAFFFAGVIGAMAGVGGSTIKGPLLIQFGLDPVIAQASSQFMLLTTISSTMIQYMALNMLPAGYGLVFFVLGLLSGVTGKAAMDWLVARRNQTSLIVYALSLYTIAAVTSMCVSPGFPSFCLCASFHEQSYFRSSFSLVSTYAYSCARVRNVCTGIHSFAPLPNRSWIGLTQIADDWHHGRFERFWFQHMCAALPGRAIVAPRL